jgi:hypothetical protein
MHPPPPGGVPPHHPRPAGVTPAVTSQLDNTGRDPQPDPEVPRPRARKLTASSPEGACRSHSRASYNPKHTLLPNDRGPEPSVAATWTNGPDASVVRVAVQERNDRLHLSIRDDGVAAPIPPAARV